MGMAESRASSCIYRVATGTSVELVPIPCCVDMGSARIAIKTNVPTTL
jgi:hypothetical protein